MFFNRWFPWRFIVRYLAQSHGFLDPIALLSRLERFSQPSEVAEPIELLRAGVVFHARGLINSRVIQHNLDWVWPYWVEQQFSPGSDAFVPRAFSSLEKDGLQAILCCCLGSKRAPGASPNHQDIGMFCNRHVCVLHLIKRIL